MEKRLYFDAMHDGEPLVHTVTGGELTKTASHVNPELLAYLAQLPEPAEHIVRTVITALSAFEGFGANRNGDGFLEEHLKNENTYTVDGKTVKLPMYRSFELFAKPFKHHINKPDSPSYGRVDRAFYNPRMKRVELVVEWDATKAPDTCAKLRKGEPIGTSMGFRCNDSDVCSICGNRARNRREYCEHLKKDMLSVYGDGRLVYAINDKGHFFDISEVKDPADRTSHAFSTAHIVNGEVADKKKKCGKDCKDCKCDTPTYKVNDTPIKVASVRLNFDKLAREGVAIAAMSEALSESLSEAPEMDKEADIALYRAPQKWNDNNISKVRVRQNTSERVNAPIKVSSDKKADIIKRVLGEVEMSDEDIETYRKASKATCGKRMNKTALRALAGYDLNKVAATTIALGIDLYPDEWQYIGLYSEFPKTAERLFDGGIVVSGEPQEFEISSGDVDHELMFKMAAGEDLIENRSLHIGALSSKLEKNAFTGRNPYLPSFQMQDIVELEEEPEEKGSLRRAMFLTGLFLGAKLVLSPDTPITEDMKALSILGAAAGMGALSGATTAAIDPHPIARSRSRITGLNTDPGVAQSRMSVTSPLAFQMLYGMPEKTAGLYASALTDSEDMVRLAANRLKSIAPFAKVASLVSVSADVLDLYNRDDIDALVVAACIRD